MSEGGFNPMMPLPDDLLSKALEQVVNISSNFTIYKWERDPELRNQSMQLFGKVAAALLNHSRADVLDMFIQAVHEVSRSTSRYLFICSTMTCDVTC